MMIRRERFSDIRASLRRSPAVGLTGPRQVGKTTLARQVASEWDSALYLDLEMPSEADKLYDPEAFLRRHSDKLVILDEVQRFPGLFPVLRGLIDVDRRPGRFLLLGSASPALARQAGESLAGRIAYHELTGLLLGEVGLAEPEKLWWRGGFPSSFLATDDHESVTWREDFARTFLERDLPGLGISVPAAALRRFWMMLAHVHGQVWNAAPFSSGLGLAAKTVRRYLDILVDTHIVRQLPPYAENLKKRLVRSPKVYLRDSGLLHTLLRLTSPEDLLVHPIVGASWEGWVIEQILARLPFGSHVSFYRTQAGAEIDLVIERPGTLPTLAIEIKFSSAPRPTRGFWSGLRDLPGARGLVVSPVSEGYPLGPDVEVVPAATLASPTWLRA
jgi:predicted AAA+ superfamily ATPase